MSKVSDVPRSGGMYKLEIIFILDFFDVGDFMPFGISISSY